MKGLRKTKAVFAMALVLALLITCGAFPVAAQEGGLVIGDANGDGLVNVTDAAILNLYVSGYTNTFPYDMADYTMDVNDDGYINRQDFDLLNKFISGSLASLPSADILRSMPQTVFQYSYVNGAWGYRNIILSIDKQGNIYTSGNITPNVDPSTIKVPKIEIESMYLDLYLASQGAITDPQMAACDRGIHVYSGNITKNGYSQNVFLKQYGDVDQDNVSPYTQTLVDWFDGYLDRIY